MSFFISLIILFQYRRLLKNMDFNCKHREYSQNPYHEGHLTFLSFVNESIFNVTA